MITIAIGPIDFGDVFGNHRKYLKMEVTVGNFDPDARSATIKIRPTTRAFSAHTYGGWEILDGMTTLVVDRPAGSASVRAHAYISYTPSMVTTRTIETGSLTVRCVPDRGSAYEGPVSMQGAALPARRTNVVMILDTSTSMAGSLSRMKTAMQRCVELMPDVDALGLVKFEGDRPAAIVSAIGRLSATRTIGSVSSPVRSIVSGAIRTLGSSISEGTSIQSGIDAGTAMIASTTSSGSLPPYNALLVVSDGYHHTLPALATPSVGSSPNVYALGIPGGPAAPPTVSSITLASVVSTPGYMLTLNTPAAMDEPFRLDKFAAQMLIDIYGLSTSSDPFVLVAPGQSTTSEFTINEADLNARVLILTDHPQELDVQLFGKDAVGTNVPLFPAPAQSSLPPPTVRTGNLSIVLDVPLNEALVRRVQGRLNLKLSLQAKRKKAIPALFIVAAESDLTLAVGVSTRVFPGRVSRVVLNAELRMYGLPLLQEITPRPEIIAHLESPSGAKSSHALHEVQGSPGSYSAPVMLREMGAYTVHFVAKGVIGPAQLHLPFQREALRGFVVGNRP